MVNIRKETCDMYIDRVGCGKDGHFGNLFRLETTMAKDSALGRYRKYFYHRLSMDKKFCKWIGNLQGKTLGCFCKPDPCRGDVTEEYLDRITKSANEAIVIGQTHWKGYVYPVKEIDVGNYISRVSVESLQNEPVNDVHDDAYEAAKASEEIDGYCTGGELCTLSDIDLYKIYC